MTISGGVSVFSPNDTSSSLVENGYYDYNGSNQRNNYVAGVNSAAPTLTINGGRFTAVGSNAVKNDDGGVLYINGGTFTCSGNLGAAVMNWSIATITNGQFTGTDNVASVVTNGAYGPHSPGKFTISGGSFTLDASATSGAVISSGKGSSSGGTLDISGGTFTGDLEPLVMDAFFTTTVTNGTFSDAKIAKYTADTSVAATLASTGMTYVGTPTAVNETLNDKATAGDTVTVVAGSADLTGLDSVEIANTGSGTVTINGQTVDSTPTVSHTDVKIFPAKAPTCTENGTVAYWYCADCDSYFLDEALTQGAGPEDLIVPALGHKLTAVPAKAATEDAAGNTAYWHCSVCGKYFSDAEGKAEITLASTVLPATGKTPAQPADPGKGTDQPTTGATTTTAAPKTGDSAAWLWSIPAFAALAGAACVAVLRKKRA